MGISLGDTLAGLHGVVGILIALQKRQRAGLGQVIKVALYEAIFNCIESLLPEYSAFGTIRSPGWKHPPRNRPRNAYLCNGGAYALLRLDL